jgi:hypothetical protein
MYKRLVSAGLLLSLVLQGQAVLAQEVGDDWRAVRALVAGEKVVVERKDGKTFEGKLSGATDQELTLEHKKAALPLDRASIARVSRYVGKAEKGKYAAIGAGIGAAAGAGAGAIKYCPDCDDSEIYIGMGLIIGAGVGALAGMAFGATKRRKALIYQTR